MKIRKELVVGYKYYFDFSYNTQIVEFCRSLKIKYGIEGFSWNNSKWRFNEPNIANEIKETYPLVEVDREVIEDQNKIVDKIEEDEFLTQKLEVIRNKKDSDINVVGISGTLRPFQKVALEFLIQAGGSAIVSLCVGAGKSLVALSLCKKLNLKKILIICPSSVKYSWQNEINNWTKDYTYLIINATSKFSKDWLNYNVIIINYDLLKKFSEILIGIHFDISIVDESQLIKNIQTIRFKYTKQILANIKHKLFLSGTPIMKHTSDLFSCLNILNPMIFSNFYSFVKKYCHLIQTRFGLEIGGCKDEEGLKHALSRVMIRMEKENILQDLPPKSEITINTELNKKDQKEYNEIQDEIKRLNFAVKMTEDDSLAKAIKMRAMGMMTALRTIVANSKQEQVMEEIDSIIDSGEKVVVFCSLNNPLELLHEKYKDISVILTAKTKDIDKGRVVTEFQNNPNIKIFFTGIKSGGAGITLTAANNAIFIDKTWAYADLVQASARIDRISQKADHINIFHFICRDTIDEAVEKIINKKRVLSEKLMDQTIPQDLEEDLTILEEI